MATITLYVAATGGREGQRVYTCRLTCGNGPLFWSPTGGQLAQLDPSSGTITLWRAPGQ